jgi:hypothetical protein
MSNKFGRLKLIRQSERGHSPVGPRAGSPERESAIAGSIRIGQWLWSPTEEPIVIADQRSALLFRMHPESKTAADQLWLLSLLRNNGTIGINAAMLIVPDSV